MLKAIEAVLGLYEDGLITGSELETRLKAREMRFWALSMVAPALPRFPDKTRATLRS